MSYTDSLTNQGISEAPSAGQEPLVVNLEGTLVRSDLLVESGFMYMSKRPLSAFRILAMWPRGKAWLQGHIAEFVEIDVSTLPYNEAVLSYIRNARALGRRVYLASACSEKYATAIADYLGVFHGVFASDRQTILAGQAKAQKFVQAFGERGFDYVGNDAADLSVWAHANKAIAVGASASVNSALGRSRTEVETLPSAKPSLAEWIKLIRVHQYAKNALVFLPLLTAHRFGLMDFATTFVAFLAFSLCASSVYILNDLADVQADRSHPTKRNRPLASGMIWPRSAVVWMSALFVGSIALALLISPRFLAVLLGYFALTTAYTFVLKRKMIIDVITLAALYTIRVIAGAVAVNVEASNWLLMFSLFFFTALALMKRYTELATRLDQGFNDPHNRNYQLADLNIVAALSAAAGMNAVTVFALYISSDTVERLYTRPQLLWFVCPLLMYWIGRALVMCQRRLMHDDPVVFALKDRVSLITAAAIVLAVLFAI